MIGHERFAPTNSWAALSSGFGPDANYLETLLKGPPEEMNWYDRARRLSSSRAYSISDLAIRRTLEAQTLQRLAMTAIAIERFCKASGSLPKNLEELVSRYLSKRPVESLGGKAHRCPPIHVACLFSNEVDALVD